MIYNAIYKCRLCGVKFNPASVGFEETAIADTQHVANGTPTYDYCFPGAKCVHRCANGGIGLADFLGWEPDPEEPMK